MWLSVCICRVYFFLWFKRSLKNLSKGLQSYIHLKYNMVADKKIGVFLFHFLSVFYSALNYMDKNVTIIWCAILRVNKAYNIKPMNHIAKTMFNRNKYSLSHNCALVHSIILATSAVKGFMVLTMRESNIIF